MKSTHQTSLDNIQFIRKFAKSQEINFSNYVNKKNKSIIYICAIFGALIQSFNLFRVLVLSTTKLQTTNNRIFFSFYMCLFIVSLLILLLHYAKLPNTSKGIYYFHLACTTFYIYWNLILNSYSLSRDSNSSKIVYISAVIFTSILLRFKPMHTITINVTSYIAFLMINYSSLDMNDFNNLSIIMFVSAFSIVTLHFQEIKYLYNQQELVRMNEVLKQEEDYLRLSLEKHQFIMEETSIFSFDWNLPDDTLYPSRNCSDTLSWPSSISNPIQWFRQRDNIFSSDQSSFFDLLSKCTKNKEHGSAEVRIRDYSSNYVWYRLQLFIQCDHNGLATTAIGVLLNIDGTTRLIANLNNQLHTHIEGSKQYIDHLKDSEEQTKIYRHDMRHSLILMEHLAHQGNMKKLLSFLKETHNKLESITPNYYCANETVNLILGSLDQLARKQNISFATDVILPQELPISDTELSSLLFNLIDNAITAASATTDTKHRFVHIKAAYNNHNLLIFTKNGYSGEILMEDDLPISTANGDGHGFGIKSIITIVDHYNGLYTFETHEQQFSAKVLLILSEYN